MVISGAWLDGVKAALAKVTSAGQAYAAIDEAYTFARNVSDEVEGGIFDTDAWRAAAVKDVDNAAFAIAKLKDAYSEDSEAPVSKTQWAADSGKLFYVYSLAQITRKGYPPDEDTGGIDEVLGNGPAALVQAILDAPVAIANYAGSVVGGIADAAGNAGKRIVGAAGGILKAGGEVVGDTVDALLPWKTILLVVGIGALGVVGVIYLSKSGALTGVAKIVKPG